MRKLASIRKVSDIIPIDGADSICSYKIDGWNVVDTIGKYNVGDLVIYIETDAWIPHEIAPFLSKGNEPKEFNGVKGERLRTIKLRKTLSQGLILPLYGNGWVDGLISKFATYESVANRPYPVWIENVTEHGYYIEPEYYENDIFDIDLSEKLNIQKWEPPIPAELSGVMKGNFPSQIPKTDEERIQNLISEFEEWKPNTIWEITEKLDGSSMTCYYINGEFGVCSRNIDLLKNETNSFWKMAIKYDLENKLIALNKNIAIQGELCGPGIQNNRYKLTDHEFFVFNVYDVDTGNYFIAEQRQKLIQKLNLKHVPVIFSNYVIPVESTVNDILLFAEGKSILNPSSEREGIVFKTNSRSFKAISNKYLLKFE